MAYIPLKSPVSHTIDTTLTDDKVLNHWKSSTIDQGHESQDDDVVIKETFCSGKNDILIFREFNWCEDVHELIIQKKMADNILTADKLAKKSGLLPFAMTRPTMITFSFLIFFLFSWIKKGMPHNLFLMVISFKTVFFLIYQFAPFQDEFIMHTCVSKCNLPAFNVSCNTFMHDNLPRKL